MKPVVIIAEAGVNHNGDLAIARRLIDVAADAGADAVKFQTFRAKNLVGRDAPKADYQARATGANESSFEMLRRLELSESDHQVLVDHCTKRGIRFLSTPFDAASLALLAQRFGMRTVKIPSGEVTNAPFLLEIARVAREVILSTGMCTMDDIERALGVLAFGFTAPPDAVPSAEAFAVAFASSEGRAALHDKVTVLHCTTEYPAPLAEVNLRAMDAMAERFGLPVGYSDHTTGIHVSLAAVARGATMIEKHFTTDRTLPGPDHAASLEPTELRQLVELARDIERALGDGDKRPTHSELRNIAVARKSLVAASAIAKGEVFNAVNVAAKRPGTGRSPFDYWRILGTRASRDYAADELLDG